jgi:hypothetical protein
MKSLWHTLYWNLKYGKLPAGAGFRWPLGGDDGPYVFLKDPNNGVRITDRYMITIDTQLGHFARPYDHTRLFP